MSTGQIEHGELLYGLEYEGVLHYDVAMRMTTIADNIDALEEVGANSGISITVAMVARAIESIGSIPKEVITSQFLRENLADDEFDRLAIMQDLIKKKRLRSNNALLVTGSSSLFSVHTDSAQTQSGA